MENCQSYASVRDSLDGTRKTTPFQSVVFFNEGSQCLIRITPLNVSIAFWFARQCAIIRTYFLH